MQATLSRIIRTEQIDTAARDRFVARETATLRRWVRRFQDG